MPDFAFLEQCFVTTSDVNLLLRTVEKSKRDSARDALPSAIVPNLHPGRLVGPVGGGPQFHICLGSIHPVIVEKDGHFGFLRTAVQLASHNGAKKPLIHKYMTNRLNF